MQILDLPTVAARHPDSHKGDYGKVLVIAGCDTMIGAPAITALAALRTGVGLVRIATDKDIIPAVLSICPYATAFPLSTSRHKDLLAFADEHDALAVGPGLGNTTATKRLVLELLTRHPGPMVLDADALNALATLEPSEWPQRRDWSNVVLTPHMGEYMRLMAAVMKRGGHLTGPSPESQDETPTPPKKSRSLVDDAPSTADGIALDMGPETPAEAPAETPAAPAAPPEPDRTPLAELLAKGTGATVVLKGHRSVVTDSIRVHINTTGNPAMATAGSGDVLTGLIAAILAGALTGKSGPKLPTVEAAALAVYLHGLAGDLAREAVIGPNAATGGLLASDILNHLPRAIAARR